MMQIIDEFAKGVYGMTAAEAQEKALCICCKQPVFVLAADGTSKYNPELFYSPAGKKEWQISAVCEKCFDNMFDEEEQ